MKLSLASVYGAPWSSDAMRSKLENADLVGAIFEKRVGDQLYDFGEEFRHIRSETAAALLFDYGHVHTAPGDTLQAVRQHRPEHVLTSPGEADLTAHVDFEEFKLQVEWQEVVDGFDGDRLCVDGPITQAEFLGRLGIIERASKLMAANPARAGEIEAGVMRLMAPNGMGTRFKAIGVRTPGLPKLPGF